MEFNRIHYSIKISLVIALFFVMLSVGCMAAIAQDSNGVWVLTNKSSESYGNSDRGTWKFTGPTLSGNSITSRLDFTECSEGPGYVATKLTWTEPPSVLNPKTKMNITFTVSAEQHPSCKAWFEHVGAAVYVGDPALPQEGLDEVNTNWNMADGTPQPQSKVFTWDVPSGNIGDVIGYKISYMGVSGQEIVEYNYTYQGQANVNSNSTNPVVGNPPPQNEGTYLESRTEYIRDDTNNKMLPGVLILLSAWKHGTTTDELVPNTPIYITILEEGSKVIHLESTVTTGVNGYVFFKWIFNDSEKNKKWIINFSPDSSDPYAPGYTATTVGSYIPDDLSAFTLESEIVSAYKGVSVSYSNGGGYTPFSPTSNNPTGLPGSLQECETSTSKICGTWTLEGDHYNAKWEQGSIAAVKVESWGTSGVVLTRNDYGGASSGASARYEGQLSGNTIQHGVVTWTYKGSTWSGTWNANW
jgi:hypothetical protein